MFKMRKLKNNNGNTTVEMCFLLPIVLWICVNVIFVFLDVIGDAVLQGECYVAIYTYENKQKQNTSEIIQSVIMKDHHLLCQGKSFVIGESNYCYQGKQGTYKTEYDLCTTRLRRWQLYGDVLQE